MMNNRKLMLGVSAALLAITTLVMVGCATEETPSQTIKDITPREAFELIQKRQGSADFEIIDVRTPEEFDGGHIENATLINYYAADFEAQIERLDKDRTYVIYCRSGGRSAGARETMRELGFREVHNVLGGIIRWTEEGFPVVE